MRNWKSAPVAVMPALFLAACAASPPKPVVRENLVQRTATVESIDQASGLVTIRTEDGYATTIHTIPANLKVDRKAFSVSSLNEPSDDKKYWFARTPSERLKQMEILRRINYGHRATVRLQRVFEIIERERR